MSTMTGTHYDTLGVGRNAEPEVIKAAYKALARKFHPDQHPSAEDADRFKEMTTAYEILSDSGKRALYDRTLPDEQAPANPAPSPAPPAPDWGIKDNVVIDDETDPDITPVTFSTLTPPPTKGPAPTVDESKPPTITGPRSTVAQRVMWKTATALLGALWFLVFCWSVYGEFHVHLPWGVESRAWIAMFAGFWAMAILGLPLMLLTPRTLPRKCIHVGLWLVLAFCAYKALLAGFAEWNGGDTNVYLPLNLSGLLLIQTILVPVGYSTRRLGQVAKAVRKIERNKTHG